jgi:hypothetical protein
MILKLVRVSCVDAVCTLPTKCLSDFLNPLFPYEFVKDESEINDS